MLFQHQLILNSYVSFTIPNLIISFLAAVLIIKKFKQPIVRNNLLLNAVVTGLIALAIGLIVKTFLGAFEMWNLRLWIYPLFIWMHRLDSFRFHLIILIMCIPPVVTAAMLIPLYIEIIARHTLELGVNMASKDAP